MEDLSVKINMTQSIRTENARKIDTVFDVPRNKSQFVCNARGALLKINGKKRSARVNGESVCRSENCESLKSAFDIATACYEKFVSKTKKLGEIRSSDSKVRTE